MKKIVVPNNVVPVMTKVLKDFPEVLQFSFANKDKLVVSQNGFKKSFYDTKELVLSLNQKVLFELSYISTFLLIMKKSYNSLTKEYKTPGYFDDPNYSLRVSKEYSYSLINPNYINYQRNLPEFITNWIDLFHSRSITSRVLFSKFFTYQKTYERYTDNKIKLDPILLFVLTPYGQEFFNKLTTNKFLLFDITKTITIPFLDKSEQPQIDITEFLWADHDTKKEYIIPNIKEMCLGEKTARIPIGKCIKINTRIDLDNVFKNFHSFNHNPILLNLLRGINKDGIFEDQYELKNFGRYYSIYSGSPQYLPKEIRNICLHKNYVFLDGDAFISAYQYNFIKKNKMLDKFPRYMEYHENKEEIRNFLHSYLIEVLKDYSLVNENPDYLKKCIKKSLTIISNGGNTKRFKRDSFKNMDSIFLNKSSIFKTDSLMRCFDYCWLLVIELLENPWVKDYISECNTILTKMIKSYTYKDTVQCSYDGNVYTLDLTSRKRTRGIKFAFLYQQWESYIMKHVREYLSEEFNKDIVGLLLHDGIAIKRAYSKNINTEHLSTYIENQTGEHVTFKLE